MMGNKKIMSAVLCLFILSYLAIPLFVHTSIAQTITDPYATGTINGGPIIDASIFGNQHLYPGQTTTIQVVIQNSGVVQSLVGYETPSPYPVTTSVSIPINTDNGQSGSDNSSSGNDGSNVSNNSGNTSSGSKCNSSTGTSGTDPASSSDSSELAGLSSLLNSGSITTTTETPVLINDYEINTGAGVDIAATTALGVTAQLSTAGTPLELLSSDYVVGGSLPAGSVSPPFTFIVRVDRSAQPGVYALPLSVTYKYLAGESDLKSAFGGILSYNNYVQGHATLYVYVVIEQAFDLVVSVVGTDNMVPGSDGTVTLQVSNVGDIYAEESVVYLMPSLPGPPQDGTSVTSTLVSSGLVQPVQSSQFLGTMDPGDVRLLTFKVAVSPYADAGDYPLSAVVSYTDAWGQQKSSNMEVFGVPVLPEMRFSVDDSPVVIKDGKSDDATLNLTNTGSETAYDAVVMMDALDPFVVSYDTVYLGDVKPGGSANATFGISVNPDAVPSTYYVTLEVKYYDDNDDSHITKTISKAIIVAPPPTILDTVAQNWPLAAGVGLAALLGLTVVGRGYLNGKKPGAKPPGPPPAPQQPASQKAPPLNIIPPETASSGGISEKEL